MTSHQGYPAHHTSATGAGYSNPGTNAYDAHATTGDKLQSRIPGTDEYRERKAYEHASGPTSGVTGSTHTGTHSTGTGLAGGTTTSHTSSGGGLASKVPGTDAYKATHPTTGTTSNAGYGASTGPTYSSTGTHGVGTGGSTVGRGATTGATGAGVASKIPGTDAHAATHGTNHHSTHASHVANSSGLQPGAPGTSTTTTTTTVPKPTVGDKISGKVEVAVGKLTHNPTKVAEGEIKQTQGKVGVQQAGLSGTTGAHHTAGTHSTGRY